MSETKRTKKSCPSFKMVTLTLDRRPLPSTLTLDPYPRPLPLTLTLDPRFSNADLWPDPFINTLVQTCLIIISLVQTNVKVNVYLLLLGRLQDKEVPSK